MARSGFVAAFLLQHLLAGAWDLHPDVPKGGYGLLLVDRLASGWGREQVEAGGSLAWFELELDPDADLDGLMDADAYAEQAAG